MESAEEIMNMLEAFDPTGALRDARELAGVCHHTVGRHVAARDAVGLSDRQAPRTELIDEHLDKLEKWVERSKGKVHADITHDKLVASSHAGSGRTKQRAVAAVELNFRMGHVRVRRPRVIEPGT